MLSSTLHKYYNKYNKNIKDKDFYLHWLENDILLELNDNIAMMNGIQPNLQRAFPNKSCFQIVDQLDSNKTETEIKSSIERLWDFLPDKGKSNILEGKHM